MIISGADLIRNSGQQAEKLDRLKVVEPVQPIQNPGQSGSSLDEDTQSALLRFARFVSDEQKRGGKGSKAPPSKKDSAANATAHERSISAYRSQAENISGEPTLGATLDILI